MHKFFKASIILGAAVIIAACGESVKKVEPTNQLFSMDINSDYQDVMDKRDVITASRLEGTPVESITLLQAENGDISKDLLYAVSLDLPEGIVITLKEFEEVMNEQMEAINEIVDFKVSPVKGSDTQITYIAETKDNGQPYFEHCKIAVEQTITTICIGTTKDQKAAQAAIDSIVFNKQ
ncbi:hypothetical protein MMG00_04395 [Ignatzschineria rhizosphaerae]|uniref:DUF1795 domain-containing protein n=1 Tax=Ignatzschineria rhizosphaerae TaxID=2923279 RepID=A0ABY3X2L9_9GAMM|nr:hypothetical protein [Ignatzschineria rhizosphaerae]UNM97094.1 hypothetical protein MMG00_04395 [Ignatzschineria rhizosphaerae]